MQQIKQQIATNVQTKPTKFSFAFADKWMVKSPLSVVVITEAKNGYTFYHRMEDGKLS